MDRVTFVYAYYNNPGMLAEQYQIWCGYPEPLKEKVKVIVVDDASPRGPAVDVPRPKGLPELEIYRVMVDIPWHQDAARNIGAHHAPEGWLMLSDMDHALPTASLRAALRDIHREGKYYTPSRYKGRMDGGLEHRAAPMGPPLNQYFLTRALYWQAGGYDEDFCGIYGTDGKFRAQLDAVCGRGVEARAVILLVYTPNHIADCRTVDYPRKQARSKQEMRAEVWRRKKEEGRGKEPRVLACDYERVL